MRWSFRANLHIDSTPCVARGTVIVGSGRSRRFQNYQVICLEAATGKPVWRTPVNLPAWGNPVVAGDRVYIGLGNGRLTESVGQPEVPAGALASFDLATGRPLWTFPVGDAVFGQPAVVGDCIGFGSRDGHLYGVDPDGREVFRRPMGGPVGAGAATAGRSVIAVSVAGRVGSVEPDGGQVEWTHDLARPGVEPHVFARPVVAGAKLYVAAEMTVGSSPIASLFCFELPADAGGAS